MKKLIFLLLICLSPFVSGEEHFISLIGKDNYNKLLKEGEVTSIFKGKEELKFLPPLENRAEILADLKELNPTIGVEILLLYKGVTLKKKQDFRKLNNVLHSISTLKGIDYFSVTRNRRHIFFHDAYVVDSPDKRRRLPDPELSRVYPKHSVYAFLNDSSFGEYVCSADYRFQSPNFTMELTNVNTISYLFVPVVDPGKIKFFIALYPYGDSILFYGFTCVNTINLFGMAEGKSDSFYNRLIALYDWFKRELEKAF